MPDQRGDRGVFRGLGVRFEQDAFIPEHGLNRFINGLHVNPSIEAAARVIESGELIDVGGRFHVGGWGGVVRFLALRPIVSGR